MASHGHRFANQALPAHVFDNPLAFARAASHPQRCMAMLASAWERAGALMSAADRQPPAGLKATLVRADPYLVIHVEPPFSRVVGDACAIAVVGRGDGERTLENVSYYITELGIDAATRATRFLLKSRTANDARGTNLGEAPVDLDAFVTQCVELATGNPPKPREARTVAPWYWWHVYRGAEVMGVFHAAPESEAWSVVYRHPILLLPELVDAAEQAHGRSHAIEGLRQMHHSLRGTPHYVPFQRLLATALANESGGSPRLNLERALTVMRDVRGVEMELGDLGRTNACEAMVRGKLASLGVDARRNYEHALELYEAARTIGVPRNDPTEIVDRDADDRAEQEIRAALGALAAPVARTTDPTWAQLFLEAGELPGFHRREDRRDVDPNPHDRAYAASGGLSSGSVEWLGNEAWAVHRLVETRWLFPSTTAARSFFEAPATLAAASENLPVVSAPAIGEATRAWGGTAAGHTPATRLSRQILMFRVGRMVAKLHVTEGPRAPQVFQVLSPALLVPHAEAAVRRAHWALSQYWLAIARGTEAANRFVQAPPRAAGSLFDELPILLLPEFPTAMAALGEAHRAAAERLIAAQAALKNSWHAYRDVMRALVRALLDEPRGERRVNADAALGLVVAHRRLDPDWAWAAIETECRARANPGG